jgi:uncharacterized protein (DUF58 family)
MKFNATQIGNQNAVTDGAYTDTNHLLSLRFAAADLSLPAKRNSRANLSGEARTRFRGRGMEFEEVRIYQAGDDIRNIDWRVTARTRVPHTKLFREERDRPTYIIVDQRSSLFFGSRRCFKSVLAARLAVLLAWAGLGDSDRVGGLIVGDKDYQDIKPRRSKHAVLELIHQTNRYNHLLTSPIAKQGSMDLRSLLMDARRLAKPGSAVYLISDFHDFDQSCEEQLHSLSRHTDTSLLHVTDPLEQFLPKHGEFSITDGQQRLSISAGDRQLRNRYHQNYQQHFDAVQLACQRLNLMLFSFSTHEDELPLMRTIFPSKRRRKQR